MVQTASGILVHLTGSFHSLATNYFDTAVGDFQSVSTTQTNICIDQPVSPNNIPSITILCNILLAETWQYCRNCQSDQERIISLTVDNSGGVNNIGTIVINGGTLQIRAGDANGGGWCWYHQQWHYPVFDRTNVLLTSDIAGTSSSTRWWRHAGSLRREHL